MKNIRSAGVKTKRELVRQGQAEADISSIHPVNTKCLKEQESFVEYKKVIKCVERLGKNMLILISYVKYKKQAMSKKG